MTGSPLLRFVQLLPDASPNGKFLLKDLPGSGKRIDVLCRDLAACFDWSPHTLPGTQLEFVALLGNEIALRVRQPQDSRPRGEVEWAEVLQQSLLGNPPENISIEETDLNGLIAAFGSNQKSHLWVLHEDGMPMADCEFDITESQNSFMLGDHKGFNSQTEESIEEHGLTRISLGNTSYLSSHCVATIISEFERMFKDV